MQAVGRTTTLAYSIFIFNGIFNLLQGVLIMDIAKSLQVGTHMIGYTYGLFVLGNMLAVIGNGRLLERVDIRKELVCAIGIMASGILGISGIINLPSFAFFTFLCGIAFGIFSSAANFLIVNLYDARERSSKLNLLHFSFSVGAIISPLLSGNLLNNGVSWQHIYQYTLVLLGLLLVFVWKTPIQVKKQTLVPEKEVEAKWGITVYAVAIALFCYSLTEQSFIFWGNTYFIEYLTLDTAQAGSLVSLFWAFMAFGRFSSSLMLRHITVEKYILLFSALGFAAFIMLLNSSAFMTVILAVALMGVGFSGLYASLLSYGTLQLKYPSAKLLSMCITFGYLGGVASTPVSSFIKSLLGLRVSLMATSGFMVIIFGIIILTSSGILGRKQE